MTWRALITARPGTCDLYRQDSTGSSALIVARQAADARGVPLRLRDVPPRVLKLLTVTGLDDWLRVEPVPTDSGDY